MIRDIALGQYIPGDSLVHRLDPRVKIVLIFLFIVFLFVAQNFVSLLLLVVSVLACILLSGVPLRQYLKSVKAILFIVLFTSVLNLFYGGGETLLKIGFMEIKSGGVSNAVFITVRIVSLILLSAVLTFTTSPTSLTDAIERLMKPLKVFHVKVHEIAMMMTIALRFVPTLLEETDKIMKAQMARGADFESGNVIQRIRNMLPILVPLFVSAIRRANELALAMDARCYHGGKGRTKMHPLQYKKRDLAAYGVCVCYVVLLTVVVKISPF